MKQDQLSPVVLVVDDNGSNVQLLGQLLDNAGYNVVPAASGAQALERARLRRPDLALVDMLMPGMDGLELGRHLRELPGLSDLPVIFVTGVTGQDSVARAFAAGAVDYITKPFVPQEMLARVQTHVELKRARDHLQLMLREREEITNVVAHDLKNPLTCIRFASQLLGRSQEPARRGELLQEIEDCTQEALEFIQRFLSMRADGEYLRQFKTERLDLRELAVQALRLQAASAEMRGMQLQLQAEGDSLPVTADHMATRNVLQNLLSNAIRYSPEGGEVTVAVSATRGGMARCLVMDRGPGIAEADQKKLFQRFMRFATARQTEYSSGLGLAIAKRDITQMGGHLWYEPRPGGGSIFGFELPQQRETAE
ncbi:MAG TPA: hybrid sensor histidine kinase/response regulator [Solimonas sp.]|nr:hybrid sensor histidine kinase/response regulator [Solimonas sp.]